MLVPIFCHLGLLGDPLDELWVEQLVFAFVMDVHRRSEIDVIGQNRPALVTALVQRAPVAASAYPRNVVGMIAMSRTSIGWFLRHFGPLAVELSCRWIVPAQAPTFSSCRAAEGQVHNC